MRRLLLLLLPALLISACTAPPPEQPPVRPSQELVPTPQDRFQAVSWAELPGWGEDEVEKAWPALLQSCRVLKKKADWKTVCELASVTPAADARAFIEAYFHPWRILPPDGEDTGLVTGYYEPVLSGSRTPDARFRYPVLSRPSDLIVGDGGERLRRKNGHTLPYFNRGEIEAGAIATTPAIVWVDDPVALFFLQVQGSGKIRLPNGNTIRVGFADHNGQPYRSIGRYLIDHGELTLDQASMDGIKAWVAAHPDRAANLFAQNPRYIFFRELPTADGPIGSQGVPLVAERSVAVDPSFLPLGAPIFLATTRPNSGEPLCRLVLAQDTGSAIHGPLRIDFFWGEGDDAGRNAGAMKQRGKLWLVWPKGAPLPRPSEH